jgi:hypothetical protein
VNVHLDPLSCDGPPGGCSGAFNEEYTHYYVLADYGCLYNPDGANQEPDADGNVQYEYRWAGIPMPTGLDYWWNFKTGAGKLALPHGP